MRTLSIAVAVVVILGAGFVAAEQDSSRPAESPEVALKTIAMRELVDGNVEDAIRQYAALADQYRQSQPELAAEALLQMAQSYERLGRPEAVAAYEDVATSFAAAPAAAEARARLGELADVGLSTQADGLSPRMLESGGGRYSDVSLDGRLALVDLPDGAGSDLAIRDLAAHQTTVLVEGTAAGWPSSAVFSLDATRVAYSWYGPQAGSYRDIYVIEAAAGSQPVLLARNLHRGFPVGWSVDGRAVLVQSDLEDRPASDRALTWIPVSGEPAMPLAQFEGWRDVNYPALSPDGTTVAFSANAREGSDERHIYLIDAATGQGEVDVVRIAGTNIDPTWTADSRWLLFLSDLGLWVVDVRGGAPAAEPILLRREGTGSLIRSSTNGELYYREASGGGQMVFLAEQDSAGWRITQSLIGEGVTWSPNGRSLAFLRQRPDAVDIIVRSVDTGAERVLAQPGRSLAQLRWTADSSALIVPARVDSTGWFLALDVTTGELAPLMPKDSPSHVRGVGGPISSDGGTLFLPTRVTPGGPITGVVAADLSTHAERTVLSFPGEGLTVPRFAMSPAALGLAISPDDRTLLVETWIENEVQGLAQLAAIETDGSSYRNVVGPIPTRAVASIAHWTPDGQSVLFFQGDHTDWQMMRVSAAGGEPEFAGLASKSVRSAIPIPELIFPLSLDLSPDGNRLAFGTQTRATTSLWTAGNVLAFLNTPR